MRPFPLLVLVFVLVANLSGAQTRPRTQEAPAPVVAFTESRALDTLVEAPEVPADLAVWVVGRASGAYAETVTPAQALTQARAAGWVAPDQAADRPLDLQSYALVLVRAFQVPTGLLYSWFPGPRYALRELVFRRVIPGALAPDGPVSGEAALRYLQATQDWKEARE